MRLISLNAWGGAVYDALAEWIPTCGADVLCLQEVTRTPGLSGATQFDDAERSLPQRADLFTDISTLLPHHHREFFASDAGPVRDGDGTVHRQDFGIAVFVHERLEVRDSEARFVHGSFAAHDDGAIADRPRIAHAVRVHDPATDTTLSVTHLHGLRDPDGKADTPARVAQAERLAELVTDVGQPGDLQIVCGDLNLLPDSETFTVLGALGLTELVGAADTRTSLYRKPLRHANYLLISDPDRVRSFAAPATPEVSDHRPLVLDV